MNQSFKSLFNKKFKDYKYNKVRVETYSDAVIAIVITLLILELHAPKFEDEKMSLILEKIFELKKEFLGWLISFLLVGVYWFQHHNVFHMATKIDLKIVLINQISLMGICLTPFTSSLIGKNCSYPISVTIFCLIFFIVSVTLCWLYKYITQNYLKPTYDKKNVLKNVKISFLFGPILYLIAAMMSWMSLTFSYIILLLIPFLFLFPLDKEEKIDLK